MTRTRKQILPALHQSDKVRNSDLNEIGEKNYTATILKYANLAVNMPQLNTNAKTVVGAINELYAHPGGSTVIPNPPIEGVIELEQGGSLELEQGGVLETEQGGGSVVGDLTSISIDGDIYTIPSGGGTTVVANPESPGNDYLHNLQVGTEIYRVAPERNTMEVTLKSNGWNSVTLRQIVDVYGLYPDPSSTIIVSPYSKNDSTDYDNYIKFGIRAIKQETNKLTFSCKTIPTSNIRVSLCWWN